MLEQTSQVPTAKAAARPAAKLAPTDDFLRRHLGCNQEQQTEMLDFLGLRSLEELTDIAVPAAIRYRGGFALPEPLGESAAVEELRAIMSRNTIAQNYIGMGYAGTHTPPVILRNILENPGWYTAYTPYQAEIAQGRLEALLNFQTMVTELTGMEIANASLLDEGTAVAEAMQLCFAKRKNESARAIHVGTECHPQTLEVLRTRAEPQGIEVRVGMTFEPSEDYFAAVFQYPGTSGGVEDLSGPIAAAHDCGALAIVATDLLALCLLRPPGEMGADVVVGNSQRFGVPLGYGGPHAAFMATRDAFKRLLPGRLVGVSVDSTGQKAYRLSLQTREQHIRRDRATSNICTAQVLLAVIAGMYAVYHGPEGLKRIAARVHALATTLAAGFKELGHAPVHEHFFDTLRVRLIGLDAAALRSRTEAAGINLRYFEDGSVGVSVDETTTEDDIDTLLALFDAKKAPVPAAAALVAITGPAIPGELARNSPPVRHPIFSLYHTETEMLRYLNRLESRDLSLTTSMIPLGSCTMKLNATTEMLPVTWPEVGQLHPFAPARQAPGYALLFKQLEHWLAELTGFAGISLQPNAGSQGEYAGLMAIRRYHQSRGEGHRDVCLIPVSAHGTNPASAVMAGMRVTAVNCTESGDIDLEDLAAKAAAHGDELAAIMVTYPSTHGVFEQGIGEVVSIVHEHGGQVYLDGANLNAQVGLCRPGDYGVDVCHLNLHKTFCIPHGGGGPGVGPIGVAKHLQPYLPGHPLADNGAGAEGTVAAAPWGSASILVITWLYIRMLGAEGLRTATQVAILNANYVARQLAPHFPVLYKGAGDLVAHECIIDVRDWKKDAGIEVEDVAKRLMDFGYHAPTMSWPVAGTLMIEPTESESKPELDRFCDAMIAIHGEIQAVAGGELPKDDNPLKGAPHTAEAVTADDWNRAYPRQQAAYPAPWTRQHKFWPAVGRIDNVHGDRNLFCSCPPVEELAEEA
ncbi:MAG: aminomethyl-transferring glycine dehydrogenase [Verrucomicrobiota bacterium]